MTSNIWLLTDECYSHFVYGGEKPFSLASVPGTKPHIIVAGSLSKTFAMTGWRLGYALAPVPLLAPPLFLLLHIFVGFVQAFVFTLLPIIYLGGAVAEEH